MDFWNWIELLVFLTVLTLITKPLGIYLSQVLSVEGKTWLDPLFKPIERFIYRLCSIDPKSEHTWKEYLFSLLIFSAISGTVTFLILRFQSFLPLNPQRWADLSSDLSFNVAVSFITNTNLQSYCPEQTVSYFSQMVALTVQNFLSPIMGLCVAAALVRSLVRSSFQGMGNFWVDFVRLGLYLFLPLATLLAVFFVSQGVPQNFNEYAKVQTIEGKKTQVIIQGPVASQEAIKLLGTNGGGYTKTNSAHPYENPSPLTNFLQMLAIFAIPAAQTYYFGRESKSQKHGWSIYAIMTVIFISGVILCAHFEKTGNPILASYGVEKDVGNMEGKEQRFGVFDSALFSTVTTSSSCGATNASIGSFTPIGGMIPLLNIQLGEIIFGGVGSGLYGMIVFILIAVFIAGLIVGKAPEYLGNKIEGFDIKMIMLALLALFVTILGFTSWAIVSDWGRAGMGNGGPHGFSEILYAFSSATGNNGSQFSGISANSVGYNVTLAFAMLFGRFLFIAPVLALAGSLASKKRVLYVPETLFPISGLTFILLVIGVIALLGALTFIPALTMGPVLEQFFMHKGISF